MSGTNGSNSSSGSIKDEVYKDQLSALYREVEQIDDGSHAALKEGVRLLDLQLDERLEQTRLVRQLTIERLRAQFAADREAMRSELGEKKAEVGETLAAELAEKRKQIEHEYQSMDLTTAAELVELKAGSTRRLRRRPNEPTPSGEKRQRKQSPQLNLQLSDAQVADDLRAMGLPVNVESAAAAARSPSRGAARTPVGRATVGPRVADTHVDGAKLAHDGKCYLRGQSVFVEATDVGKVAAVIQSIANNEVTVKCVGENKRITIPVIDLAEGCVILKKRS